MSNLLITPHVPFSDIDGTPLSDGFINIGEKDKDPIQYPISAYWDEAKTKPITQPIRTKNGYIVNNGVFAKIYIDQQNCSVLVKNRFQTTIYLDSNSILFSNFAAVNELVQIETTRATAAESTLNTLINNEVDRATSAENSLQVQINANGIGNRAYLTYAAMTSDASNIPANSKATVTNDLDPAKNGDYQFDGSVFTKSIYDPIQQSKSYTDSKKLESDNLLIERTTGDIYFKQNNIPGYYISQTDGSFQPISSGLIAFFPVVNGKTYYVKCSEFASAFQISLNKYNFVSTETLGKVTLESTAFSDIKKFTVSNADAKYAFINIKLPTLSFDISTSLAVSESIEAVKKVSKMGNVEISDDYSRSKIVEVVLSSGERYNTSKLVTGWYVSLTDKTIQPFATWKIALIPVTPGEKLIIKSSSLSDPFKIGFYESDNLVTGMQSFNYSSEIIDNSVHVTVPTGANFIGINAYIVGAGFDYDAQNALSVSDIDGTVSEKQVSRLNNQSIIDIQARQMLASLDYSSIDQSILRFKEKRFLTFGDSITEGTQGGYVKYIAEMLQCSLENRGSSGAKANRLQRIMTGQPSRDPATAGWTFPVIDYSNVAGITIMIGTNDASPSATDQTIGSIADIPTGRIEDVSDKNAYLQSFPNTFYGNLGMCIEYVKWKNPNTEITLITSPINGQFPNEMRQMRLHQIEIAQYYGVNLVDAQNLCGISLKDIPKFTYDNLHFNESGNLKFGEYVARQIAVS